MSTHGIQRDPCCVFPADGKTATTDLFELKPVADGVYAAIATPQYKINWVWLFFDNVYLTISRCGICSGLCVWPAWKSVLRREA